MISLKKQAGFTLIELIVVVTIMLIMTMVIFFNYNKFNEGILLDNLAYDMSLTIRQAQIYGLAVKEAPGLTVASGISDATSHTNFSYAYGVHFDTSNLAKFLLFIDSSVINGKYDSSPDEKLQTYSFQRGINIKELCVGSGNFTANCASTIGGSGGSAGTKVANLDITFLRPNPEALIYAKDSGGNTVCSTVSPCGTATIILQNADGSIKKAVTVSATGQISVQSAN